MLYMRSVSELFVFIGNRLLELPVGLLLIPNLPNPPFRPNFLKPGQVGVLSPNGQVANRKRRKQLSRHQLQLLLDRSMGRALGRALDRAMDRALDPAWHRAQDQDRILVDKYNPGQPGNVRPCHLLSVDLLSSVPVFS